MSLESLLRDSPVSEGTTSFAGRAGVRDRASLSVIMVSGALSIAGTSSAGPTRIWGAPYVHETDTTASPSRETVTTQIETETEATRKAVSELRRISGLTWEQLAWLFGVSRRSVHFWASGKPFERHQPRAAHACVGCRPRCRPRHSTQHPCSSARFP